MKKMEKSKIIGVGLSLLLMGTVAFGSLNLDNTAFADKESNVKSSIEKDKKDQQDKTVVFSLNKKGEIIINTNASIKQIVDELVRINKESKFDLDLEKLIKYKDELLNSKGLTPSKLADLMEDVFDEIEDVVEDMEDEIEDLKDKKDNNFSEQTKKQFVKEKEKLKEEYNEKRQVLRKKLKQDIKEGKDPEKVKKEFEENINKLENSQTQAIKELKDKFLAQSKKENELKNKDGKKDRKDKENNEEDDDDDDDDEDDDD